MSHVILVGTLVSVKEFEGGDGIFTISICNEDNTCIDVEVVVKNMLDNKMIRLIDIGDQIGIKAKFRKINEEAKLVAERVSFISRKKGK